jgi:hypothetical protein
VDIGSHKENASKQKLEPGFDSIKAGKALAALDPDFRITFRFSFSHTAAKYVWRQIFSLCAEPIFFSDSSERPAATTGWPLARSMRR